MSSALKRYSQLAVLTVSAGVIYPLLYLRQNFEVSILESFGITLTQLSQGYTILGLMFMLTYLPSGWLADRVSPKILIVFSLFMTGLLGVWFSSMPSAGAVHFIFFAWGITTGLTFWSALIKAVSTIGHSNEQGRFFGIMDAGRGLVEAVLATLAVALFAYVLNKLGQSTELALKRVIYIYIAALWIAAPLVFFLLDSKKSEENHRANNDSPEPIKANLIPSLKLILSKSETWYSAIIILTSYQLFWATYSFSGYLQNIYGLSAVAVGTITVAKLWMRPIGGVAAGFAGDFLNRDSVLAWLLVSSSATLAILCFVPMGIASALLIVIVLFIGFTTYALKGLYWATLESLDMPDKIKGLAIGVMSVIGFSPETYLPLINSELLERFPGRQGYVIYFCGIAACGLVGAWAAWRLKKTVSARASSP